MVGQHSSRHPKVAFEHLSCGSPMWTHAVIVKHTHWISKTKCKKIKIKGKIFIMTVEMIIFWIYWVQ